MRLLSYFIARKGVNASKIAANGFCCRLSANVARSPFNTNESVNFHRIPHVMHASRLISVLFRLLLIIVVSMPFILLLLALQTERVVPRSGTLTPPELAQIEQLLLESAPTSTTQATSQELSLSETDLDLLFRYGMQLMGLVPAWSGQVRLSDGTIAIETSIAMTGSESPLFLNVTGELQKVDQELHLSGLRIGQIDLPQAFQQFALSRLQSNLLSRNSGFSEFRELAANIEPLSITSDEFSLEVSWQPDLINRIASRTRQLFVPESDRRRIVAYYEQIRNIVATVPTDIRAVSLNTFFVPLFSYANEQAEAGNDPIMENRALLQALAIYVNDESIQQLLGPEIAGDVEPIQFIEVRLLRRQDLAQHLTSIAATTSSSGAGFAQLLSTTKEAYDARYSSGFSFSDLTANSVGVALATYATRDYDSALEMQLRLSAVENESDYMPAGGSNRDGLSEADFASIYRDRNSPEYEQRVTEIQQLISERPLFANLSSSN